MIYSHHDFVLSILVSVKYNLLIINYLAILSVLTCNIAHIDLRYGLCWLAI